MNPALLLLALRLILALALYAFLAEILLALWRDFRTVQLSSEAVPHASLEVSEGPDPGRTYPLSEVNLIGRAVDNTICIREDTVSTYHARLSFVGGQWWLEDLGSKNGTRVNDIVVEAPLVITYGDQIHFGGVRVLLLAGNLAEEVEASTSDGTASKPIDASK